ncbi:MAG: lysylphosphatidylglycerol synthase transmembrane domain-containing protein [Candidatus Promineifilaceae bacterium]
MMAEGQKSIPELPPLPTRTVWYWVRLLLGIGLGGLVLWYVARDIPLAEVRRTFTTIRPFYVLLSVILVVLTIVIRAVRWRLTFHPPGIIPAYLDVFWSLTFGQLLNLILPFRLGDVARLVRLERWTHVGASRTLGTIVVEKTLDVAALGVSLLVVLPLLPAFMGGSPWLIAAATLLSLAGLYLLAYQGEWLIYLNQKIGRFLPSALAQRLHQWLVTGLGGLDALRYQKTNLRLIGLTGILAVLAIFTPLVLFPAVHLSLGLGEAVLLHVLLTVGSVPPSTPFKVGVFEGVTVFLLQQMGVTNDAAALTFAFLWHMALVVPQVVLGSLSSTMHTTSHAPAHAPGE